MQLTIHIGPSKTASTSLQAIMPLLGRPYVIGPDWARTLARAPGVLKFKSVTVPPGTIISDQGLGDFDFHPPRVIADRLSQGFGRCTVIYVIRDYRERLKSLYDFKERHGVGSADEVGARCRRIDGLETGRQSNTLIHARGRSQ